MGTCCYPVANRLDPLEGSRRVHAGEHRDELLATVADDEIALADRLENRSGHHTESDVPRGMTVGVVEPFEEIHVDHGHGQRLTVASSPAQLDDDPFIEIAPVGKPGETVAAGKPPQALGAKHDRGGENRGHAEENETGDLGGPVEQPVGKRGVARVVEIPERRGDHDQCRVLDDRQQSRGERDRES